MSSPSDPWPTDEPAGPHHTSTQEIPTVPPSGATAVGKHLPPHPDAAPPAPVPAAMDAPQPTGPVDFVPGPPGAPQAASPSPQPAPPPPVPPTPIPEGEPEPATATGQIWPETLESDLLGHEEKKKHRLRAPGNRTALAALGLALLSVVLLELGLGLGFGGESYWSAVTLWSAFATVCAALGLLALASSYPGNRLRSGTAWRVGAAGLVGLAVFWLLVVLPTVATDRGFVLTAALAALGGALWVGPRSKA